MRAVRFVLALMLILAGPVSVVPTPAAAQPIPGVGAAPETPAPAEPDLVKLLLDVLKDDAARARMIAQLEAAQGGTSAEAAPAPPRFSYGRRIAEYSATAAQRAVQWGRSLWTDIMRAPRALAGLDAEALKVIWAAMSDLLLILVATAGTFTALRAMAIPFYRRFGRTVAGQPLRRRIVPFLVAGVVDFAIVGAAWLIGNGIALLVFGEHGHVALMQALYLNAFLAVELVKAAFRLVLSPATIELRPVRLTDWAAKRLYRVIRLVASILGYGFLLVLPIITDEAGLVEARSTTALVWLLAIVVTVVAVLRYRQPVGDWLLAQLDRTPSGAAAEPGTTGPLVPMAEPTPALEGADAAALAQPMAVAAPADPGDVAAAVPSEAGAVTRQGTDDRLRAFAHGWSWLALIWLAWMLLTVMRQRPGAVATMLENSGRVALALVAAFVVSGLLGRWIDNGISLPQRLVERVPLLESRLNYYVPWFLLAIRLLITVGVLVYAVLTLGIVPRTGWLQRIIGPEVAGKVVSILAIGLFAFVAWIALASWVEYRLNANYGRVPTSREQTLLTLLRNAATIVILALALMFTLSEIGVNIGPLVASAGVVGLAIGFGAQKMVQDIITGIFIQFENAINVGDVISAGGITGSVERLTVRSVSLRDGAGTYHIIPFSSVDTVSNQTRDFSFYMFDLRVAYRESVPDVKKAIFDAFEEVRFDPEQGGFILGEFEWWGLSSFSPDAVIVSGRIKTWPGKQAGVGRAFNECLKRIFDERGIQIPFPQRTVWFGEDRNGEAPPLRMRRDPPREG